MLEIVCQLFCGLTWGGGYRGPGSSPDRADDEQAAVPPARLRTSGGRSPLLMVWAMTELMLGVPAREPRVRAL